jgi:hypothetical protein
MAARKAEEPEEPDGSVATERTAHDRARRVFVG